MGEGAGVVVLEEYEHAKARGAKIYAEVIGYGTVRRRLSHHRAVAGRRRRLPQHERGAEARRHLVRPTSTTSTRTAPRRRSATRSNSARWSGCSAMPPSRVSMSSTKSSIGHLLGAAGAVEAIFSHPGHPRQRRPADPQSRQSVGRNARSTSCRKRARKREIDVALSNSFGFGGTNASVIVQRVTD